jgi:signal transduction histidine kinase
MIKQYTFLLIFMFFALLGLISLQGYFSYNDFQIKTQEFAQAIDQTFSEAVEIERKERKKIVLTAFRSVLSDTSNVKITASYDSLEKKTLFHITDAKTNEGITSISFSEDNRALDSLTEQDRLITIDLLVKATGKYLDDSAIFYWTDALGEEMIELTNTTIIDTNRLAAVYDSLLQLKRIYSSFNIGLVDLKTVVGDTIKTPSPWQTQVYNTDLNTDQWDAYAYFENPFRNIIKSAWLTIGGSLLIVIITGLAFFILLKTIFQQKKLAEVKADFIDNISHELQTPIATLRAANEGMEKFDVFKDPVKTARYVQLQKQAIHRLSTMVDELLRNSIYKRKPQLKSRINIDCDQLIQAIIARYKLKTGAQVTFDFVPNSDKQTLFTDPMAFETICDNLIGNAIKHNTQELRLVKISANYEDAQFLLTIEDNGPGIPASLREKVFEKFYQRHPNIKGQGFGLAYVKQLVEELNGKIWISQSELAGTRFNIQLPQ